MAPAGPVPRDGFARGAERLARRYRLVHDDALFAVDGFLAGSDERRLAELRAALADPSVRAVACARGGHGLLRLLDALDLDGVDRVVLGFSDVTALHGALAARGIASVHGPVVTQLGALGDDDAAALFAVLEGAPPTTWRGLATVRGGRASGVAVGGNLEVLTRLVGTRHLPPLAGAVLFLEEIGERPYRIDRQLTHLALAGALERVVAVVVGDLVRCEEPERPGAPPSPTAAEVVREGLGRLGVPVLLDAPFGHGTRNRAFVHGGRVTVDADAGEVRFLDGLR